MNSRESENSDVSAGAKANADTASTLRRSRSGMAAMSPDTGLVVVIDHGAVEVVDPLARQQWTLAPAAGVTFSRPRISTDGHRIVAQTQEAVVAWPLDQPETAEATARWVESLTNAVDDDHAPGGLVWR